jgi:hypothetical protein
MQFMGGCGDVGDIALLDANIIEVWILTAS